MKGLKTFPQGGVHPHGWKELTRHLAIKNAPIPAVSVVPLQQHLGSPSECTVKVGDSIGEGKLIGKSTGFISANIHSPVPGKVVDMNEVFLPLGIKTKAVHIEFEGEFDRSGKKWERQEWENTAPDQLRKTIEEGGIVGLGGATFPTQVKYSIREGSSVEYFVVNGAECEPYLTADHRLLLEKTNEIVEGARIVRKILNADKVVIAIEENKPDAIQSMYEVVARQKLDFEVVPLKMKYPQGDEKQLLKALTGREVPSGGLPIDIGAVVSNVGSIFAIFEVVVFGKPLIERVVTVTGSAIQNPQNLKVRIGTRIGELIEDCGGFKEEPGKIIAGGPMMGFAIYDLDIPVTKGVSGVLAFSRHEVKSYLETSCIQCGRCVRACPLGLSPTLLFKWIDHHEYDEALENGLLDCKECGCCSFVCPAHLPLVQGMKLGKLMSRKKKA